MSKHTAGEWLPSRINLKHLNIVQVGASFRCSVVGGEPDDAVIVATIHGRTETECEANAILIAAAPNLLNELDVRVGDIVMLRKAIEASDPKAELLIRVDDMLRETRDAISKATPTK